MAHRSPTQTCRSWHGRLPRRFACPSIRFSNARSAAGWARARPSGCSTSSLIDISVVLEQIFVERHGGRSERSRNLSICAALVESEAPRATVHLVLGRHLARALDQTLQ